jgi:hypothetical protein
MSQKLDQERELFAHLTIDDLQELARDYEQLLAKARTMAQRRLSSELIPATSGRPRWMPVVPSRARLVTAGADHIGRVKPDLVSDLVSVLLGVGAGHTANIRRYPHALKRTRPSKFNACAGLHREMAGIERVIIAA